MLIVQTDQFGLDQSFSKSYKSALFSLWSIRNLLFHLNHI